MHAPPQAELAALKQQRAAPAPAGADVQGQLLAALLGNSPVGTMLQGMLAGGAVPGAKAAGKRKAHGTPAGANKRAPGTASSGRGGGAAAAAAAAAEAAAERTKKAAALKQKNEPWRVERADGTGGTWPGAVSNDELLAMVQEFGEVRAGSHATTASRVAACMPERALRNPLRSSLALLELSCSSAAARTCSALPRCPPLSLPPCPPCPPSLPLHAPAACCVQGPVKCNISFTRVAQSPKYRQDILAVPHKHSADGERLYYIP